MNKPGVASSKSRRQEDAAPPEAATPSGPAPPAGEDQIPPDSELVEKSKAGDYQAFDELVTRYRGKVYAMIVNMIHNDADAWDLAQDAFIKAWKALPKFEARSNFYTWLYRITHNVTYDWMRKKKITAGGTELDDNINPNTIEPGAIARPKESDSPDRHLERGELREKIEAAINELSADHRAVILLKEIQGLKYEEIAKALDCTIGTVMSRLFYARKKLQSLLKDTYEAH